MVLQWLAYQAAFVPLVSLFTDTSSPEEMDKWKAQINTVLVFLGRMNMYSIAAKRSKDVLSRLLDAAKAAAETADAQRRQQEALMAVRAQREREREKQRKQQRKAEHQNQAQLMTSQIQTSHQHNGVQIVPKMEAHQSSAINSPVDPMAPNGPPAGFGMASMPMTIGVGSVASVSPSMSTPSGAFHASSDFMAYNHSPSSSQNMPVRTPMDTATMSTPIHPQNVPQGFWDDMLWDTFPEMDVTSQGFNSGNYNNGWTANGMEGTGQWSYSHG
jgi:hypothetical protein